MGTLLWSLRGVWFQACKICLSQSFTLVPWAIEVKYLISFSHQSFQACTSKRRNALFSWLSLLDVLQHLSGQLCQIQPLIPAGRCRCKVLGYFCLFVFSFEGPTLPLSLLHLFQVYCFPMSLLVRHHSSEQEKDARHKYS